MLMCSTSMAHTRVRNEPVHGGAPGMDRGFVEHKHGRNIADAAFLYLSIDGLALSKRLRAATRFQESVDRR